MPIIQKEIKLDTTDIPKENVDKAASEVGSYLINETLRYLSRGESPVLGEGKFQALSREYAKDEKNGRRTPNLEVDGSLKDEFTFTNVGKYLRVGYFGGVESDIADGHNQLTEKAKAWASKTNFPKRRYIPDKNQKYVPKIEKEITNILNKYRRPTVKKEVNAEKVTPRLVFDIGESAETTVVSLDNILNKDSLVSILIRQLEDET